METSPEIGSLFSTERRKIRKSVWKIAIPVMLANLTTPFVGLADTAVMGRLDHAYYIGGVAMGTFVFSLITVVFSFQRMAITGLVAQAYGAGDRVDIFRYLYQGVVVALGLGCAIIVLSWPIITMSKALLTASPEVLSGMAQYIDIIAFAGPAICLNMVALGLLFGMQRVRSCMTQLIVINITNIAFNLYFVFGLGMKIDGVAMASVIAQYFGLGVSSVMIIAALGHMMTWPKFRFGEVLAIKPLARYASLGLDLTIRTSCIIFGEVLVLNAAGSMSDEALAASQLGFVAFGLIAYGLDGFAHAVEALVGQAIGQKNPLTLRRSIAESTILATVMAVVMTIFIFIFSHVFLNFMTDLPGVISEAEDILLWIIIMPVVSIWAFLLDGVFIGATKAKTMRDTMLISLAVFVPLLFAAQTYAGLDGVWFAFNVFLAMRGLTLWMKKGEVVRAALA